MISNERRWPSYGRPQRQPQYNQGYGQSYNQGNQGYNNQGYNQQPYQQQPRPPVQEDTLKSAEIEVERKRFVLLLKENARGRFLRVIEMSGNKSNSIIIPGTGLAEFKRILDEFAKDIPAAPAPAPAPENPAP